MDVKVFFGLGLLWISKSFWSLPRTVSPALLRQDMARLHRRKSRLKQFRQNLEMCRQAGGSLKVESPLIFRFCAFSGLPSFGTGRGSCYLDSKFTSGTELPIFCSVLRRKDNSVGLYSAHSDLVLSWSAVRALIVLCFRHWYAHAGQGIKGQAICSFVVNFIRPSMTKDHQRAWTAV